MAPAFFASMAPRIAPKSAPTIALTIFSPFESHANNPESACRAEGRREHDRDDRKILDERNVAEYTIAIGITNDDEDKWTLILQSHFNCPNQT